MAKLNDLLDSRIAITQRRLAGLRFVRAFGAPIALSSLYLSLALLDITKLVSPTISTIFSLSVFTLVLFLTLRGLFSFSWPGRDVAEELFDKTSLVRPLSSLADRAVAPTPDAEILWRVHRARLREKAAELRPPRFTTQWNKLDRLRLRFILPLFLFASALIAGHQSIPRISESLQPDIGVLFGADSVKFEAWINPPEYTGQAPIFLSHVADDVEVPIGSRLVVRSEAPSPPTLILYGREETKTKFTSVTGRNFSAETTLEEDTTASIDWWGERQKWSISLIPDSPPIVEFTEAPVATLNDRTQFAYQTSDDYGVTALAIEFSLVDSDDEQFSETIPLNLPAETTTEVADSVTLDLTRHRWAGLEVSARLRSSDYRENVAYSEPHKFLLPESLFLQPMAQAAQEVRTLILRETEEYSDSEGEIASPSYDDSINITDSNGLDEAPDQVNQAADMLLALTFSPQTSFNDRAIYLALKHALSQLENAQSKIEAEAAEDILWAAALRAEFGSAADALKAFQSARRALEQALRDGASESRLKRLLEAFKTAAEDLVAARIAEGRARGPQPKQPDTDQESGGSFGQNDFQDMLKALEEFSETGATESARKALDQVSDFLENLQFQITENSNNQSNDGWNIEPQDNDRRASKEERDLVEQLQEFSDILREQREVNEDTFHGQDTNQALAEQQSKLSEMTDQLKESLESKQSQQGGSGEESREQGLMQGLEAIEELQSKAAEALKRNRPYTAQRYQDQATQKLSDMIGELASALDEERGIEEIVDPFGRAAGGEADDSFEIPDGVQRQRAKEILEELRSRYRKSKDTKEREYLKRLLDRF